jgi:hypothetical protein
MRTSRLLLLAVACFGSGSLLARAAGPLDDDVKALRLRQETLRKDIVKIERASADVLDVQQTRDRGFELNSEERGMEKRARLDFHIFMERYRNDTLETLSILDRLCGGKAEDPLKRLFGKALDDLVEVSWSDREFDAIVDELGDAYKVKFSVRGEYDSRLTMSLDGNFSLRSILDQIEEVYGMKLVVEGNEAVFVGAP